jgi:pimeloyl-ACP methyl ester carboxylesterase
MRGVFSAHLEGFRHIYMDLPGFGKSNSQAVLTTDDYASIVNLFLSQVNSDGEIIVGHSFGGKVALLLNPKLLVLLSSAGIYRPKSLTVKLKIALFKTLKYLGLGKLRSVFASDDAKALSKEMYETFKIVVDEDMSGQFQVYGGRALLLWGDADTATPLESAEKIDALIEDSRLVVYNGDHYFFMKHADEVCKEIETEVSAQ